MYKQPIVAWSSVRLRVRPTASARNSRPTTHVSQPNTSLDFTTFGVTGVLQSDVGVQTLLQPYNQILQYKQIIIILLRIIHNLTQLNFINSITAQSTLSINHKQRILILKIQTILIPNNTQDKFNYLICLVAFGEGSGSRCARFVKNLLR